MKVCNIRFELLVVKPISTMQIDEGPICYVYVCRSYDNTYVKVWLMNHGLENVIHVISVRELKWEKKN